MDSNMSHPLVYVISGHGTCIYIKKLVMINASVTTPQITILCKFFNSKHVLISLKTIPECRIILSPF